MAIIRLIVAIVLILIVSLLICYDWTQALSAPHRLRWYVIANSDLPEGARINKEKLNTKLGWLEPSEESFITNGILPLNKYTLRYVKAGERLESNMLSENPEISPINKKSLVVYIKVPRDSVIGLKPRTLLGFIKGDKVIPNADEKTLVEKGFLLRTVFLASENGPDAILAIEVPQKKLKVLAPVLEAHDWIPVMLMK